MKRKLSAKATRYIPESRERYVKRKPSLKFTKVIKHSSFDERFVYIGPNLSKNYFSCAEDFLFHTQIISWLAVELYRIRYEVFKLH